MVIDFLNRLESLKGLQFEIPTSSVNTNDAGRNKKIHEIFFGTFNTSNIIGSIDSINGMTQFTAKHE